MQLLRAQVSRVAANSVRSTSNIGTSSSRVTPAWTRPVAPARRSLHRFTTQASPEKETAIAESSPEAALEFKPFDEVKDELARVEEATLLSSKIEDSFARVGYSRECEVAVNEQINIEYNMSYVYHAMSSYFARDNVALPGIADYFRNSSLEERGHAQQLMDFQATRGGRTKLAHITMPLSDYNHPEKGDALHAMELALSLEKLNFHKLRELHDIADKNEDAQMADFVEAMLEEQVKGTKEVADYVAQLRRVGKGLGVFEFDRQLAADAKALTQTLSMPV